MVRVDNEQLKLDVQGRFEQVPRNIHGAVNATHVTSIVAASNNSVPIEVVLLVFQSPAANVVKFYNFSHMLNKLKHAFS